MNQQVIDRLWMLFWGSTYILIGLPIYCICAVFRLILDTVYGFLPDDRRNIIMNADIIIYVSVRSAIENGLELPMKIAQELKNATPLSVLFERMQNTNQDENI